MRLRPVLTLALLCCAVTASALAAKPKPPELKLAVHQTPEVAAAGQKVKLAIDVQPPDGIKLNQYPGITLTVTPAAGLALDKNEAFAGTKTPIDDPEKFGFTTTPRLELAGTLSGKGVASLSGTLKFFYCVKASGYCAPGEMPVTIPVKSK